MEILEIIWWKFLEFTTNLLLVIGVTALLTSVVKITSAFIDLLLLQYFL